MKEIHLGPDNVHILTQSDYKLGLNHAAIYDTTSPHLFCRGELLAIAKRIKHNKDSVIIEFVKDGLTKNVNDVDEFVKWITEVFEEGDPEIHGFSSYVKNEIEKQNII